MAVSYDHPYDVRWTVASPKAGEALRFAIDLALAALYVRMLLVAVATSATVNSHGRVQEPDLSNFFVAIAIAMFFAGGVRVLRYRVKRRGIPSLVMGADRKSVV